MPSSNSANSFLQADGIVQQVDTVNRELRVLVNGTSVRFDVPPDCAVILHEEQVKLRLLQPEDRVRVFYRAGPRGLHTACRAEVHAGNPSPSS